VKLHIIILLFPLALCAQDQKSDADAPKVPDYSLQCDAFPYSVVACHSFNELVAAKDDDVLTMLRRPEAYLCFRNSDDIFSIVTIGSPYDVTFKKQPNGTLQAPGVVSYRRFKDGQDDEYQFSFGNWRTINRDDYPFFSSPPKEDPTISVSQSEISVQHSFKNVGGGTTNYVIQIRRSTLRSTETLQWQNPPKDAKSPPARGSEDFEGHCTAFK
jgi:hypothetical protein